LERQENRFVAHKHRLQMKGAGTISDQIHFLGKKDSELQQLAAGLLKTGRIIWGRSSKSKKQIAFSIEGGACKSFACRRKDQTGRSSRSSEAGL
jgi:hypothetical protein